MNEYLDEVVKGSDGKLHQKVIGQSGQRPVQGGRLRPVRRQEVSGRIVGFCGRATPPHCISATDGSAESARQRASHSLRRHNEAACIDAIINVAVFDTAVDATVWRERKRPLLLNKFKA